ncbi:hypothetical protein V1291_003605 [Nitrobacteraceae bacterium AZCC 1564]
MREIAGVNRDVGFTYVPAGDHRLFHFAQVSGWASTQAMMPARLK